MKVKELIEKLSEFNPEANIIISNINDHTEVSFGWGFKYSNDGKEIQKKDATHIYIDILKVGEHFGYEDTPTPYEDHSHSENN